ncbi:hypothetical protein TNCV_182601, partial [Trichonephila clavipes]
PSSLSKRATEWESDSGHMSDVLPRGSQTLKRPQPRRHHTVGFETGSMTSLPRPSLDLEYREIKCHQRRPKRLLQCRRPLANKAVDVPCGLGLCCGI